MSKLYHFILDPYCRRIRLQLSEQGVTSALVDERPWAPSQQLLDLNPAGVLPVMQDEAGRAICGVEALGEFLEERQPGLLPGNAYARAEARRLVAWFDAKMNREVTEPLVMEKFMKRALGCGVPDSAVIRAAKSNLKYHLDYVAYLTERYRGWLAGDYFSLADVTAAAHLSVLDYLGDVAWDEYEPAKEWYARVKSRPSFRPILADHVPGAPPPKHYTDLDF